MPLKAYKLIKLRKNGTLGPLFINATQIIPIGKWLEAEFHPTKGYKERQGWHCTSEPNAPHLSKNGRVWCEVSIEDYEEMDRPQIQGSKWLLAQRMKVNKVLG